MGRTLKQYRHLIIILIFTAIMLALHQLIFLYGDDYTYGAMHQDGLLAFFQQHIEHYMLANGRAQVHFIVSLLLIFDVYVWRILNPFLITATLYILTKIICFKQKPCSRRFCSVLLANIAAFMTIDVVILKESVYWLDGSLNYLYPLFMLFWAYYLFLCSLSDEKKHRFLPLLCFFAGATTEQAGLMTVGLLVVTMLYGIWRKQRPRAVHYFCLLTAIVGYLTVVLAPGTFERSLIEGDYFSLVHLKNLASFFMAEPATSFFVVLTALSTLYWQFKLSMECFYHKQNKCFLVLNLFIFAGIFITLCIYLVVLITCQHESLFFPLCLVMIAASIYTFGLLMLRRKNPLPLFFLLAAVGAQAMLAITPALYYRTTLSTIFALFVPIASVLTEIKKVPAISILAILVLLGIHNTISIFQGYASNYQVNQDNLATIHAAQADPTQPDIVLLPMNSDRYAHSPLQNSPYHVEKLIEYYGLRPGSVQIATSIPSAEEP